MERRNYSNFSKCGSSNWKQQNLSESGSVLKKNELIANVINFSCRKRKIVRVKKERQTQKCNASKGAESKD